MPLLGTETILGNAIANVVLAPNAPPDMQAKIRLQWIQISKVIIDHIVAVTQVQATVTPGAPLSAPGPMVPIPPFTTSLVASAPGAPVVGIIAVPTTGIPATGTLL